MYYICVVKIYLFYFYWSLTENTFPGNINLAYPPLQSPITERVTSERLLNHAYQVFCLFSLILIMLRSIDYIIIIKK
jgi:hypothetical protein